VVYGVGGTWFRWCNVVYGVGGTWRGGVWWCKEQRRHLRVYVVVVVVYGVGGTLCMVFETISLELAPIALYFLCSGTTLNNKCQFAL